MQEFEAAQQVRMTDEEAQRVMQILAERQRQREELQSRPTVMDVATMANAPVDEVYAALAAVRTAPVVEQAPKKRISGWMIPAIAFCSLLMLFITVRGVSIMITAARAEAATPLPPPPLIESSTAKVAPAPLGQPSADVVPTTGD